MIKTLNALEIIGKFLNLIKDIYENPTISIIFHGKRLNAFPVGSETRQECVLSQLLFNILLEVLIWEIGQEKEIKGIMIEMDEEKLFSNDMVLYIEKLKESGKNRANE